MMRLILVGPPGVGKGSQAKILAKELNIPHISTGDMFRSHFQNNTKLGRLAKEYMSLGQLVPDQVTNEMVEERLNEADVTKGFILDGYPRNIDQADFLKSLLDKKSWQLNRVINIDADAAVIVRRLSGRRSCPTCGRVYHIDSQPPKVEGLCDDDQTVLIQRNDDQAAIIKDRLTIYHNETYPLIAYYRDEDLVTNIDGDQPLSQVTQEILTVIGK
jgi:adenylate kinase